MLSRYPQHWKFTPVSLRFFVALSRDPIPGQASWQKWSPGCPGWWRAAYRGQPGSGWLHRDWRYSQFLVDLHARHVCTLLYNVCIYIYLAHLTNMIMWWQHHVYAPFKNPFDVMFRKYQNYFNCSQMFGCHAITSISRLLTHNIQQYVCCFIFLPWP